MATIITNTDFLNSKVSINNGVTGLTLSMDELSLISEQYRRLSLYTYINENYNILGPNLEYESEKDAYIAVADEAIRQMDKYDLIEEEAIREAFEQLYIDYEVCSDYDLEK